MFHVHAQAKTNLEVFKLLVDSSIAEIVRKTTDSEKDIFLNLKLGGFYSVLEDQIYKSFKLGGKIYPRKIDLRKILSWATQ